MQRPAGVGLVAGTRGDVVRTGEHVAPRVPAIGFRERAVDRMREPQRLRAAVVLGGPRHLRRHRCGQTCYTSRRAPRLESEQHEGARGALRHAANSEVGLDSAVRGPRRDGKPGRNVLHGGPVGISPASTSSMPSTSAIAAHCSDSSATSPPQASAARTRRLRESWSSSFGAPAIAFSAAATPCTAAAPAACSMRAGWRVHRLDDARDDGTLVGASVAPQRTLEQAGCRRLPAALERDRPAPRARGATSDASTQTDPGALAQSACGPAAGARRRRGSAGRSCRRGCGGPPPRSDDSGATSKNASCTACARSFSPCVAACRYTTPS